MLGIILLISIPIVSTLFFGRIFCGYVCPIGALQEFVAIKDKLIKISYKLEKKLKNIRILLFITLFVVTYIKSDFIFSYISPFKSIFNASGTILQISIALIILILSLFIYRPFCRYACPLSLALEIVSKFSFYKIRKDKDFCNGCKSCQKKCNITAIDENNNIDNVSCIRCGDCLDCVKINNSKGK